PGTSGSGGTGRTRSRSTSPTPARRSSACPAPRRVRRDRPHVLSAVASVPCPFASPPRSPYSAPQRRNVQLEQPAQHVGRIQMIAGELDSPYIHRPADVVQPPAH